MSRYHSSMGANPGEGRTKNLRKQIHRSNSVGLMFRRVVYTLCTQPCITIIDGDPMDTSVVDLSLNQTYLDESKLKTTFKPMIALDKNCNFYTCACTTDFVVEGSKCSTNNIFQKTKKKVKSIFNKTLLTNRTNN